MSQKEKKRRGIFIKLFVHWYLILYHGTTLYLSLCLYPLASPNAVLSYSLIPFILFSSVFDFRYFSEFAFFFFFFYIFFTFIFFFVFGIRCLIIFALHSYILFIIFFYCICFRYRHSLLIYTSNLTFLILILLKKIGFDRIFFIIVIFILSSLFAVCFFALLYIFF